MPLTRYLDFVILADQVEVVDGGVASFVVRVLSSPAGEGEEAERVQVPDHLTEWVGWLDIRQIDSDLSAQIELGKILGNLLLPPYARGLFQSSVAVLAADEGLRVRLRLADELADLPWEFAWVASHRGQPTAAGFLALDTRISIVRHESVARRLPDADDDSAPAAAHRRVVVAQASPAGWTPLPSLAEERRLLEEALAGVAGVTTTFVADASPAAVLDAVSAGADVFHFGGHGMADPDGGGSIALADADNQADLLPAGRLAEILQAKGVRLAVLGACETGRRPGPGKAGANVWGGVATALLQRGIPAVVAMQFSIGDRRAAAFAGATYRALVGGLTIDEAVAVGRTATRTTARGEQPDARDWAVPVLYLRAGDARLFEPVTEPAAREAAIAETVSVLQQIGMNKGVVVGILTGEAGGVGVHQEVDDNAGVVIGAIGGPLADSSDALARALAALRDLNPPKDG